MKKSQIKVFEELLQNNDFKGKKALRHLLWLNTTEPKFKVGDKVIFSDSSQRTYGVPMINFVGYIEKVFTHSDSEKYLYGINVPIKNGKKEHTGYACCSEYDLKVCKTKKEVNIINGVDNHAFVTSIR